jgi:hypothetical protein
MPKRSPIGCLIFCLTLTVIAGRDGYTCPNEVGNCLEHNAFGNFDHTRDRIRPRPLGNWPTTPRQPPSRMPSPTPSVVSCPSFL